MDLIIWIIVVVVCALIACIVVDLLLPAPPRPPQQVNLVKALIWLAALLQILHLAGWLHR
jgi:hypothetical protein